MASLPRSSESLVVVKRCWSWAANWLYRRLFARSRALDGEPAGLGWDVEGANLGIEPLSGDGNIPESQDCDDIATEQVVDLDQSAGRVHHWCAFCAKGVRPKATCRSPGRIEAEVQREVDEENGYAFAVGVGCAGEVLTR